ncbi:MAG: tetratricopeptide repeat protein [Sedimentisphaerales bacterium]|nr:tetratricopeptide repeat protein [Sedimentisphaerales bacterium]
MRQLIFTLLVTLNLFSSPAFTAGKSAVSNPQILENIPDFDTRAIVILGYLGQRPGFHNTAKWPSVAFAIGDGTILLTAAHCVSHYQVTSQRPVSVDTIVLSPYYGDIFEFEILALDEKADLAILKAPWPSHPALSLAGEQELISAEQILIASRPQSKHIANQLRTELLPVLKIDETDPNTALQLKGTKQVVRGWSGSPMVIPENGKVAGVLTKLGKISVKRFRIFRSTRHDAKGCSVRSIYELLRKNNLESQALGRPSDLQEIPDAEQAFYLATDFFEQLFNINIEGHFQAAQGFLKLRPDSVQAYLLLGFASVAKAGDPNVPEHIYHELAESSYQKALQLDPNNSHTHAVYGNFLKKLGRNAESLAQSEAALSIDPNNRLALINKLTLLKSTELKDTAQRLISIDPNDPNFWFYYSRALLNLGENEKALEAAQKAVALDPNGLFYGALADALVKLDRPDEAEPYYKLMTEKCGCQNCWVRYANFLVKSCPTKLDEAEKALGIAESKKQDRVSKEDMANLRMNLTNERYGALLEESPEKAEALARKLIKKSPQDGYNYWALASALRKQEKYHEAVTAAEKAVKLYPDGSFHPRLANCLAKAGELEKAERTYNRMLDLYPNRPRYWYWYAEFLVDYLPDRIEEARKALEKAQDAPDKRWPIKDEEFNELFEKIENKTAAIQEN